MLVIQIRFRIKIKNTPEFRIAIKLGFISAKGGLDKARPHLEATASCTKGKLFAAEGYCAKGGAKSLITHLYGNQSRPIRLNNRGGFNVTFVL